MSHNSTYRGSYSSAFMAVVGRVLRPTPFSGAVVSPHITHTNDYFRGGAALHGGIDFNFVGGTNARAQPSWREYSLCADFGEARIP